MGHGDVLGEWCMLELMDSLKADAPIGTKISGDMIQAPDTSLVVTMEEPNEFSIADLDEAVADVAHRYRPVVEEGGQPLDEGGLPGAARARHHDDVDRRRRGAQRGRGHGRGGGRPVGRFAEGLATG